MSVNSVCVSAVYYVSSAGHEAAECHAAVIVSRTLLQCVQKKKDQNVLLQYLLSDSGNSDNIWYAVS